MPNYESRFGAYGSYGTGAFTTTAAAATQPHSAINLSVKADGSPQVAAEAMPPAEGQPYGSAAFLSSTSEAAATGSAITGPGGTAASLLDLTRPSSHAPLLG